MSIHFIIAIILLYISILITGIEYVKIKSVFADKGLLGWKMLRLRNRLFTGTIFRLFDMLYNRHVDAIFFAMILLPIAGIVIIIFITKYELFNIFISQILILNIVLLLNNYRSRYSLDGADQFNTISITSLSICLLINPQNFEDYFFLFIAFQLTLSYFIAGLFKLTSLEWLSGRAIGDVFNGQVYGNAFISDTFERFPQLRLVLSIIVILWEVLFPLSIFLNEKLFISFLVIGIMFHLFNAIFMGLNCFFISFASGYPALVYCYDLIRHYLPITGVSYVPYTA